MKSRTLVSLVFAGLVSLYALPVSAQETFDLQFRLGRGEVLYYTRSFESSFSFQIAVPGAAPIRTSAMAQAEGRVAVRVLDLNQDGAMLVESVVEDARVTADGRTEQPIGEPALLRVRPDGKIVEWLIKPATYEGFEDFPTGLPGRPVKAGDSWTAQFRYRQEGFTIAMNQTATLLGVEAGTEGRVARLRYISEGRLVDLSLPPPPPGFQWRTTSFTARGTDEIEWLVDRGRLLSDKAEVTVEFQLELVGEGLTIRGGGTLRFTLQDRALPRESVTVPPPPPELLIAPGKGMGPSTLDLPLADLNSRLGAASAPESLELFNAPRVTWPTGLAAYVDPADSAKVIGLETGDRRYRTDRGIGFGSSQGAVLFAYGTSPVIIEMTLPSVGGARLLIYNDQGIAFGVTSDTQHARRGPAHAPIGTVDWVTVFAPGGAGKIFKMP